MSSIIFLVILILWIAYFVYDKYQDGKAFEKRYEELGLQYEQIVDHMQDVAKGLMTERMADKGNLEKLINALIAKNATEARDLNLTDKVSITNQPIQSPEQDLTPLDQLSQEEWEEQVLGKQPENKEES